MTDSDATSAALRAALAVSPDNLLLRLHLAATLRDGGRTTRMISWHHRITNVSAAHLSCSTLG